MGQETGQAHINRSQEQMFNKDCPQEVYFCPQACYLLKYKDFQIVRKKKMSRFLRKKRDILGL